MANLLSINTLRPFCPNNRGHPCPFFSCFMVFSVNQSVALFLLATSNGLSESQRPNSSINSSGIS